jgi:hypothetical protein
MEDNCGWSVVDWSIFLAALTTASGVFLAQVATLVVTIRTGRAIQEVRKETKEQTNMLTYQTEQSFGLEAVAESKIDRPKE